MLKFKGFLACSSRKEDRKVVKYFRKLIESFGFELYIHDINDNKTELSKQIKRKISESEVFFAIVTQRGNTIPSWLRVETTFAYTFLENRIFLLYDNNISKFMKRDIFNEPSVIKVPFIKNNLQWNQYKIIGALVKFRDRILNKRFIPMYKYKEIYFRTIIIDKDTAKRKIKRDIEALRDGVCEVLHSANSLKDSSLSFDENTLKLLSSVDSYHTVDYKIVKNSENYQRIKFNIDPCLKKGENVQFTYEYIGNNYKAFTYEDAFSYNKEHHLDFIRGTSFVRTNTLLSVPADRIIMQVDFPKNYHIKKYGSYVLVGRINNADEDENKKLEPYQVSHANGLTSLILRIENPILGYNYNLYWKPPKRSQL